MAWRGGTRPGLRATALATVVCATACGGGPAPAPRSAPGPVAGPPHEPVEGVGAGDPTDGVDDGPRLEAKITEPRCASVPPGGLVDLRRVVPDAVFDIRYATANNFTGAPLPGYELAGAWLAEAPARALSQVQMDLREAGYGLVIYDAYRPARATRAMVAWVQAQGRAAWIDEGYVGQTSTHARGTTVDVGLVRQADPGAATGAGTVVDMGSGFDVFGPESHFDRGGAAQPARVLLRDAMRRRGFEPYAREWWHFRFPVEGARRLDVPYACARPAGAP